MRFCYRITKYDPQKRNADGHYIPSEWTSFSDIGRTFGAAVLGEQEYRRVEDAYVSSALAFLNEAGIHKLSLVEVQNSKSIQVVQIELHDGSICAVEDAEELFRAVLREQFWCRFEWQSEAYLHFGWDYYMYAGLAYNCPKSIAYTERQGLFVEPFVSPHRAGG
jgi:hypothetical protein